MSDEDFILERLMDEEDDLKQWREFLKLLLGKESNVEFVTVTPTEIINPPSNVPLNTKIFLKNLFSIVRFFIITLTPKSLIFGEREYSIEQVFPFTPTGRFNARFYLTLIGLPPFLLQKLRIFAK